jgi:hypothetical protein
MNLFDLLIFYVFFRGGIALLVFGLLFGYWALIWGLKILGWAGEAANKKIQASLDSPAEPPSWDTKKIYGKPKNDNNSVPKLKKLTLDLLPKHMR